MKLISESRPFVDPFNGRLYVTGKRLDKSNRLRYRRYLDDGETPDHLVIAENSRVPDGWTLYQADN